MDVRVKTGIVTDSNSGLSVAHAKDLHIGLVPMPFTIDGAEFYENYTITREEFFAKMENNADIKTSQPSPESLIRIWDEMLREFDELVYIPMSSGLSGSIMSAKIVAEDYDGKVFVVDNHRISCTQKQSALEAYAMAQSGMDGASIAKVLEDNSLEASIYIAVDTLEYLKKGGRVTAAGAALASIMNIKPILQIQGDKLDAFAKVRGPKAAKEKMLQAVENDMKTRFAGREVIIKGAYTCSEEDAAAWKRQIEERFPGHVISLDPLALSISCHIGPGATAIVCMPKLKEAPDTVFEH